MDSWGGIFNQWREQKKISIENSKGERTRLNRDCGTWELNNDKRLLFAAELSEIHQRPASYFENSFNEYLHYVTVMLLSPLIHVLTPFSLYGLSGSLRIDLRWPFVDKMRKIVIWKISTTRAEPSQAYDDYSIRIKMTYKGISFSQKNIIKAASWELYCCSEREKKGRNASMYARSQYVNAWLLSVSLVLSLFLFISLFLSIYLYLSLSLSIFSSWIRVIGRAPEICIAQFLKF